MTELKAVKYQNIIASYSALLKSELPAYVHYNNLCALLKKEFNFFWVGFYMKHKKEELIIDAYQGEVPCFTIQLGKGVCGTAALEQKTQIVANVHQFSGYIACHPEPNSEIVVPGVQNGECLFVLDIDHVEQDYFDDIDRKYLEQLCVMILQVKKDN